MTRYEIVNEKRLAVIYAEGGKWFAARYDLNTQSGRDGIPVEKSGPFKFEVQARTWACDWTGRTGLLNEYRV